MNDTPLSSHGRLNALIAVCSVALLVPLFGPLLTGRVFVSSDLVWFHLPLRYLYQQALHAGDTVLWTPSIFAGLYLHGEGQAGLFHPFHQLLYRLMPLGMAFNLELIASYPMAFAGTFWFLRRLRFSHTAALFGAMLFAFSGFNLLHHSHLNMVAIVAHMPWLLAAADVLIANERKRAQTLAFTGMAVILGSEFLLGFPQAVWWTLLALVAFGVFRASQLRRRRQLVPCAAAVAVGILLGALQLLPTLDAAAHSTRVGRPSSFALTYSLHPFNLVQLSSPYFFQSGAYLAWATSSHEYGIYSGAVLLASLIWVWMRRSALQERRGLVTAATVFAAVNLILALGRYGGLSVILAYLPVFQSLRGPVRYIVLVQFAMAILAAVTIDDLLAIADGRSTAAAGRMTFLWIPVAVGIGMLLFNTHWLPYGPRTFAGVGAAASGVAIVAVVTGLLYLGGRRVRWAIAALIVVTAVDLGAWGIRFIYREPAQTIEAMTQAVPAAPDNPAEAYAFVARYSPYSSDVLVLRGYRLTTGYVGLFPATRHPLESETARRLTGTRWFFSRDGVRQPVEDSVDRVRLLDDQGHPASGNVRLAVDRPGDLIADVDTPARRILAFTERFHDGWSATVDGAPLQMVRVEGDFLGCLVDAGRYHVSLRFMPRSFVYGSIVSAIGAVLLAGLLIVRLI
jgi:hypothetical protein